MDMAKVLAKLPGVAGSLTDKATSPPDYDGAPIEEPAPTDTGVADSDEDAPAEDHLRLVGALWPHAGDTHTDAQAQVGTTQSDAHDQVVTRQIDAQDEVVTRSSVVK